MSNRTTTIATFTVWSLDVWGNESDGFDVNDRCKVGTIELTNPQDMSDDELCAELIRAGFLKPKSLEALGEIDGDLETCLYVNGSNGCPWLQLEFAEAETIEPETDAGPTDR